MEDPDDRRGMDVHLPPELSAFVKEEVRRGDYAVPDEVVCDAVRRLMDERRWFDDADGKIAEGLAQLERGEGIDGDEVFARMRARIEEHRRAGL